MPVHHYVKFPQGGQLHYGVVIPRMFASLSKGANSGSKLLIEDAVQPRQWIALEENAVDVERPEYEAHIRQCFELAREQDEELGDVVAIGKLLARHIPGRGLAWYVVTRISGNVVKLVYRNYSAERIMDPEWGFARNLTKAQCEQALLESAFVEMLSMLLGEKEP